MSYVNVFTCDLVTWWPGDLWMGVIRHAVREEEKKSENGEAQKKKEDEKRSP